MASITPLPSLSDTKIKTAKPQEKEYTLQDGKGLYLFIKPIGTRIWLFNYYRPVSKKRALISFGSYPRVSLGNVRTKQNNARALLAKGMNL